MKFYYVIQPNMFKMVQLMTKESLPNIHNLSVFI